VNATALNPLASVEVAEGVAEEAMAAGAAAAVEAATDKPDKPDKAKSRQRQTQEEQDRLPTVREARDKLPAIAARARLPLMKVVGLEAAKIRVAVEDAGADSKASPARSEDA
jgi:Spy/CpxP family protein refolding chaperone